jgi:hypothetical protein
MAVKKAVKKAVKQAAKKPAKKAPAKAVKKGAAYKCEVCGLAVSVDEVCGCVDTCDILCCETQMKPMRKRA